MDPAAAFTKLWPMITAYPEPAIVLIAVTAGGAFWLGRFFHGGAIASRDAQIDALKARLDLKDDQLAAARQEAEREPVSVASETDPADSSAVVDESVRRGSILSDLLRLYMLSSDGISNEMAAGLELPPIDWMNAELSKRGERWRVATAQGRNVQTYEVM